MDSTCPARLLVGAARRLEPLDAGLARETYLQALGAALWAGEWLRREKRRSEARQQLRRAYEMLTSMGIEAFADRARRELQATGKRSANVTSPR